MEEMKEFLLEQPNLQYQGFAFKHRAAETKY